MDTTNFVRRSPGAAFPCLLLVLLAAGSHPARAQDRPPDFDGDGFSDLAVGVRGEDLPPAVTDGGAVNVLYGAAAGLTALDDQLWTQDSPGILDQAENGDQFGVALAWGDFDGDGFSDLAVGAPMEDVGTISDAGVVNVLYGSASGLSATGNQLWHQDVAGMPGDASPGDRFGFSATAGDFDGDGFDDLAIGVIGDLMVFRGANVDNTGSVTVLYGSAAGLAIAGVQSWDQIVLADAPQPNDLWGWSLAAGDFNGDGFDELVIGAPFKDLARVDTGMVWRLDGSAAGLEAGVESNQFYLQGKKKFPDLNCPNPAILETCQEKGDHFGWAVAAGDLDGDGFDDLVIGVPGERYNAGSSGGSNDTGQVHVLYGTSNGPRRGGSQIWNQDQPDVLDKGEAGDLFGNALAAGDVNGDGFDDLLVGVPGEKVPPTPSPTEAGMVQVLLGRAGKLSTTGQQVWSQDSPGILDAEESVDHFGAALSTGDFDGDGRSDLAVGVPLEDLPGGAGTAFNGGAVNVLYGFTSGLSDSRNQFWTQDSPDVEDAVEAGDVFGSSLAPR